MYRPFRFLNTPLRVVDNCAKSVNETVGEYRRERERRGRERVIDGGERKVN